MELLKTILALTSQLFAIGLPPNVIDEAGFRKWINALAGVVAAITATTPTPLDDLAARLLSLATGNDEVWSLFYTILTRIMGQALARGTADEITAECVTMADPQLAALSEQTGIGAAELLAIFKLVTDVIGWFRNRKGA